MEVKYRKEYADDGSIDDSNIKTKEAVRGQLLNSFEYNESCEIKILYIIRLQMIMIKTNCIFKFFVLIRS